MNIQTLNRKAFENVTRGLEKIKEYYETRDMKCLEQAQADLKNARKEDPEYLGAIFYSGMVMDLIGRPADASWFFEKILRETKDKNVETEARFNLAVSYYHQYRQEFLKLAETNFLNVIVTTKDDTFRNLARANLAQTYAMWMRPSHDQRKALESGGRRDAVYQHIRSKFDHFTKCDESVRDAIRKSSVRKLVRHVIRKFSVRARLKHDMWNRIEATIDNACGMAYMYRTDYLEPGRTDTDELLRKSLKCLESAEEKLPSDWANTCDLGSVHLRLGVHSDTKLRDQEFSQAKDMLEKVVKELRPGYGFALYELGRLHRVRGLWNEAREYFDRALAVPERYRDIDDLSVNEERERAIHGDDRYP